MDTYRSYQMIKMLLNFIFLSPSLSTPIKKLTILQSMMNAKLNLHGFWHCHENGLIKTIQTIPHNLYVSVKLTPLNHGLRLILVYPNTQ